MKMKYRDYLRKFKNVRNYKGLDGDREVDVPDPEPISKPKQGPGRPRKGSE